MEPDLSALAFWSGRNYMKRKAMLGYVDVSVPTFGDSSPAYIGHNLGFIPEYDIWDELSRTDMLWSNKLPYVGMAGFAGTLPFVTLTEWMDENNLTIILHNESGSTHTIRVYYLIYKDYAP